MRRVLSVARRACAMLLLTCGALAVLLAVWLLSGWPLGIDRALDVSGRPAQADAIVCIGGGTTGDDLPTADGWERISTSVQLHADGFAPIVVFTGRGNARVSEAEIYADAAGWLGLPRAARRLDPLPASTAEHPAALLRSLPGHIDVASRLILVTSELHSRRVLATFRKYGFTQVTVVSAYRAKQPAPLEQRTRVSGLATFRRDRKAYDDPFVTLIRRSSTLLVALREWAALAAYRWHGVV